MSQTTPVSHSSSLLHPTDCPYRWPWCCSWLPDPDEEAESPVCPSCLKPLSFSFRPLGEKPHIFPECNHALHKVLSLSSLIFRALLIVRPTPNRYVSPLSTVPHLVLLNLAYWHFWGTSETNEGQRQGQWQIHQYAPSILFISRFLSHKVPQSLPRWLAWGIQTTAPHFLDETLHPQHAPSFAACHHYKIHSTQTKTIWQIMRDSWKHTTVKTLVMLMPHPFRCAQNSLQSPKPLTQHNPSHVSLP